MAQAFVTSELIERWQALASQWGAPAQAIDDAYADVLARFSEPHRHYHTLEHVGEVLDVVIALDGGAAVQAAAWFHDVIYDTSAPDNEARSAAYAGEVLARLGAPPDVVSEAQRLIELTAGHAAEAGDANGRLLVQADLSILSAEPSRYARYTRDVRAEYAQVDDDAWRNGRAAALRSLLEVVSDERARSNLALELADLAPAET